METKICKICGKEYPCCQTERSHFAWMDVACSPEHAAEYFKKVAIARGELKEEPVVKASKKKAKAAEPIKEVEVVQNDEPIDGFMNEPSEIEIGE